MSESTMADLHRAVNVAEDGLSEAVVDAVRSIRRGLCDPVAREGQAVDRWFSQHHGLPVTIIEAKNGNAWSFEGQFIDASRRGSVKLTSSGGAYVRQRYGELRLIHADPSTLIVDASGVSAAYVVRPGDQITESVVVSMFDSEREQTETTDYTADDAKRLLAAGIADDQACGHCTGECDSCQQEAAEVIAKIRAEAVREASKKILAPSSVTVAFEKYADWIGGSEPSSQCVREARACDEGWSDGYRDAIDDQHPQSTGAHTSNPYRDQG